MKLFSVGCCLSSILATTIAQLVVPNLSTSLSSSTLSESPTSTPIIDSSSNNNTDTTGVEEPKPITCTPGISVGYMLIRAPNMSSILTIGNQYNVSWDYTVPVTAPPTYLDIYIQLKAPGVRTTWKQVVVLKQPAVPRWFLWKPDGLVDGKYQMHFVPDGKETFNVPSNKQPCFASGESVPSNSATFSIGNPRGDLGNYPDRFPPNSATRLSLSKLIVLMSFGSYFVAIP